MGGVCFGLRSQDMMIWPTAKAATVPRMIFQGIVVLGVASSQSIGFVSGSKGKSGFFWIHLRKIILSIKDVIGGRPCGTYLAPLFSVMILME